MQSMFAFVGLGLRILVIHLSPSWVAQFRGCGFHSLGTVCSVLRVGVLPVSFSRRVCSSSDGCIGWKPTGVEEHCVCTHGLRNIRNYIRTVTLITVLFPRLHCSALLPHPCPTPFRWPLHVAQAGLTLWLPMCVVMLLT